MRGSLCSTVERARLGDRKAINELVNAIDSRLLRFCYSLTRNQALAQDVKQETLIRVVERISTLKDPAKFQSWVFQTAKNLFLDHVKSPKNNYHLELDSVPGELSYESHVSDLKLALDETVKSLSRSESDVLLLVEVHGYSYAETAKLLGYSENAVRCRLHRARIQARELRKAG